MKTANIKRALRLCRGSLMSTDLVPVLTHFCFAGTTVHAFNDITAVVADIKTGLNLGLRGDTLLGIIDTLGQDMELIANKDSVTLTSGKTKTVLAAMPAKEFLFEVPEQKELLRIKLTEALAYGMRMCRSTVGSSALQREFTGVAVLEEKDSICLYSTDDIRLSRYWVQPSSVEKKGKAECRFLIPESSVAQLLEVWDARHEKEEEKYDAYLSFSKDWMWMKLKGATFYSKLMPESPPDYQDMYAKVLPKTPWKDIPEGFEASVTRAEILTAQEMQPTLTMKVQSNKLTCSVKGAALGEFDEDINFNSGAAFTLLLSPGKIKPLVASCEKMIFSINCAAFKKGNFVCLVSPLSE